MSSTSSKETKKKLSTPGLVAIIVCGAILVSLIAILIIEEIVLQKVVISNKTDRNIESISITFETEENEELILPVLDSISVAAGETNKYSYSPVDMLGYATEIVFAIKFEDGETIWLYDGDFNGIYRGRIDAEFYEEAGEYYLKLKAGVGLTNSTENTYCDTEFILKPDEGDWNYTDEVWFDEDLDVEDIFLEEEFED